MEDNRTVRSSQPQNALNYQRKQRESSTRPSKRRVLKKDPVSAPVNALVPKLAQRRDLTLVLPVDTNYL
jgi:hypothetical protein